MVWGSKPRGKAMFRNTKTAKNVAHNVELSHETKTMKATPWRQKTCSGRGCRHNFKGNEPRRVALDSSRRYCQRCHDTGNVTPMSFMEQEIVRQRGGTAIPPENFGKFERATNGTESQDFVDIR